jgi:hypothetical protein
MRGSKQFLTLRRIILLTFSGATSPKRLFDCEDENSRILQNISDYLPHDTASRPACHNLTLITMWTSQAKPWLRQLSASCHEGPGILQGQHMWQTNWHCVKSSSEYFGFPLSVSFQQCSTFIHSFFHH